MIRKKGRKPKISERRRSKRLGRASLALCGSGPHGSRVSPRDMEVKANLVARARGDRSTLGIQPKEWMTSGEVARALNMTDAAIRRWAREGLVEAIKTPGGQYRFRREALARLLQVRHPNGTTIERRRTKT